MITDASIVDYADLSSKPFFPGLIKYMASGPVVAMVWEGLDAVKTGRVMLGATNPLSSAPGELLISDLKAKGGTNYLFIFVQAPFVEIMLSLLDGTYATARTLSKAQRRKLHCRLITNVLLLCMLMHSLFRWFPEGIVQYNLNQSAWIFE